jgi:hypothetical protein
MLKSIFTLAAVIPFILFQLPAKKYDKNYYGFIFYTNSETHLIDTLAYCKMQMTLGGYDSVFANFSITKRFERYDPVKYNIIEGSMRGYIYKEVMYPDLEWRSVCKLYDYTIIFPISKLKGYDRLMGNFDKNTFYFVIGENDSTSQAYKVQE